MCQNKPLYPKIATSASVLKYLPPLQMEDFVEVLRGMYVKSLELLQPYNVTHVNPACIDSAF